MGMQGMEKIKLEREREEHFEDQQRWAKSLRERDDAILHLYALVEEFYSAASRMDSRCRCFKPFCSRPQCPNNNMGKCRMGFAMLEAERIGVEVKP